MALKNVHDIPPKGFFIYVPETGWTSTQYLGLDAAAKELQRHRQANPRFGWKTDLQSCELAVLQYTEARLRSMKGGDRWLSDAPSESPPSFPSRSRLRQQGAAVAEGAGSVKKIVAGVGAVISWLGSGLKPVDQQTANARAEICSTCLKNQRLEGLERAVGTAGDILHSIMQAKSEMKLTTPHDAKLHQCAACLCVLQTKVWAPAEHVRKGITPEIEKELTPQCWIRPILAHSD